MTADTGTFSYCVGGDVVDDVCVSGLDVRVIVMEPRGVRWATPLSTSAMVARTRPMTVPMQEELLMTCYISEPLMSSLKSPVCVLILGPHETSFPYVLPMQSSSI